MGRLIVFCCSWLLNCKGCNSNMPGSTIWPRLTSRVTTNREGLYQSTEENQPQLYLYDMHITSSSQSNVVNYTLALTCSILAVINCSSEARGTALIVFAPVRDLCSLATEPTWNWGLTLRNVIWPPQHLPSNNSSLYDSNSSEMRSR